MMLMTNTYSDDATMEEKTYQELRCIRCLLERLLRTMDESLFVDYQFEKFGRGYKTNVTTTKGGD